MGETSPCIVLSVFLTPFLAPSTVRDVGPMGEGSRPVMAPSFRVRSGVSLDDDPAVATKVMPAVEEVSDLPGNFFGV